MKNLSYQECEQYILDIPKWDSKHTLDEVSGFLESMGDPGMKRKKIHVAGTNGKGSVCAYLQSILSNAGFRVGMFTSPHLVTMRERISICGEMISEEDFTCIFYKVLCNMEDTKVFLSFFEFLFVMAMLAFEEKEVDYIILETGLGGRLDATNVIRSCQACVITGIGYDHMEFLGNTLEEIAWEKAGIMKAGVPVVILNKIPEVTRKLRETAEKIKSPLLEVHQSDIKINEIENKTIDFSFHSRYYMYIRLILSTKAIYQTENAALAIQAVEVLKEKKITSKHIADGLYQTFWPGRMEEIEKDIFLDGAHNEDGMRAFLRTVAADHCSGRRYLLFGAVRDKQYEKIVKMIVQAELFSEVAVTHLETDRSTSAENLYETFMQYTCLPCTACKDAEAALSLLKQKKLNGDVIYIAGSLYLAGQIKRGEENAE